MSIGNEGEERLQCHISYKNELKMDHGLKHKMETIKLLETNIGENLGLGKEFLYLTPKA